MLCLSADKQHALFCGLNRLSPFLRVASPLKMIQLHCSGVLLGFTKTESLCTDCPAQYMCFM